MKKSQIMIGVAVFAVLAAACGGGGEAAIPDANGEVIIELSEFEFSPNEITVTAGQEVTFVLRNVGEKEHEFMIGHDVDTDEGFPNGFHDDFFAEMSPMVSPMDAAMGLEGMVDMDDSMTDDEMRDDDPMEIAHGFMVMRAPTEEATVTFTVPENAVGEWDIGCFEEDGAHWDDGMQGTLKVVEG